MIGAGSELERECFDTRRVLIGRDTWVGRDCHFSAVRAMADELRSGDDVFIGPSTNVLTPIFELGDYVKLNNHVLINGYARCYVGHNSWIGQNSLLNAVEDLVIGNNVSLGMQPACSPTPSRASCSRVARSTPSRPRPSRTMSVAGPNHMIGPGVTIGRRTIILPNAVVSGDVPEELRRGCPSQGPHRHDQAVRRPDHGGKLDLMRRLIGGDTSSSIRDGIGPSRRFRGPSERRLGPVHGDGQG